MGYSIAIDRGNTAVKAAVYQGDMHVKTFTGHRLDASLLADITASYGPLDAAIYCSVVARHPEEPQLLARAAERVIVMTRDTPVPLRIDYSGALGVDRIAAAVGAATLVPDAWLLVVDAGTAVTFDVVSPDGVFAGGNIAPGIRMRLQALSHYTSALPSLDEPAAIDTASGAFGHDTEQAMVRGAVYGLAGAAESYMRRLPRGARLVVTGGSAPLLCSVINLPVLHCPHLVTDGLNRILNS